MTLVVGPSFSPTCLPSLGTFRRAALTWCHRCIACCIAVHFSFFPSLLAISSLWPFCSLCGGGCTAEKQIKCMTFIYMIYPTSFTAIEMQTDVCRRKVSTQVQYRFAHQKAWPKNRDSLHFEMCWGVHISHIVSCPSQGGSEGEDKFSI